MSLAKIFKDSIHYPFSDWSKLIILGILLFIPSIVAVITQQFPSAILAFLTAILLIIVGFVVEGYSISVIKDTIEGSNAIPDFEWTNNFISGLKLFVIEIVYTIGLAIVFAIVLWVTGGFKLLNSMVNINATTSAVPVVASNIAPMMNYNLTASGVPAAASNMTSIANPTINTVSTTIPSASPLLFVGLILVLIVAIVAMFFLVISTCRLAKTGSIKEGLSWSGIIGDIKVIGVGKLVAWYILLIIIAIILAFIAAIVLAILGFIPVVGAIIAAIVLAFIITPFFTLFSARATGLIYVNE